MLNLTLDYIPDSWLYIWKLKQISIHIRPIVLRQTFLASLACTEKYLYDISCQPFAHQLLILTQRCVIILLGL